MTAVNNAPEAPLRCAPPPRQPAADPSYTSPNMQATSPSTVQASPSATPHPAFFPNGSTSHQHQHQHQRSSDTPKARARLACHSCRRSKVRCGPDSGEVQRPCPQCIKGNKRCTWPDTDQDPDPNTVKRPSEPADHNAAFGDRPPESRKRRKNPPSASFEKLAASDADVYNPLHFSESAWDELYTIFTQHYGTELSFLHGPTFLDKLKNGGPQKLPAYFATLRLAFLALTVPFHKTLENHTSQDPRQLARRYADAAEAQATDINARSSPTLEIPQALLMLSLRAHGAAQGSKAFNLLGDAIRTMQLLGCQFDQELVDRDVDDKKRSITRQEQRESSFKERRFIVEESRRRTFWSCFIIDRYISSGDYKTRSILMDDPLVLVQLPCCEDSFDLGIKTKTRKLRESDRDFVRRQHKYRQELDDYRHGHDKHPPGFVKDAKVEWEDEDAQSPLVWFIKALDVYADVMRLSCTMTRRNDKTKPWEEHPDDPELSFCKLNKKVDVLTRKLPATLKLSSSVLEVHIHRRRATAYFLMHTTLLICKMALHREYLPFITGPKSYPEGPIDGPRWEELQANAPPEFWKDSARSFFRATSDCFDLITSCKQRGALVETPLTAWVCFTVSFSIMWLAFFPNFDQEGVLCKGKDRPDKMVVDNYNRVVKIMQDLEERVGLTRTFRRRLHNLFETLAGFRLEYKGDPDSPTDKTVSLGLKKYLDVENDHKEFGANVEEHDSAASERVPLPDLGVLLTPKATPTANANHHSPNGMKNEVKSEDGTSNERTPDASSLHQPPPSWSSVNNPKPKGYEPSIPHQSHMSPQQHHQSPLPHQYANTNDATFRANTDPRQQFAPHSMVTYTSVVREQVHPSTIDHRAGGQPEYNPAAHDFYQIEIMPPQLQNIYPHADWGQHQPMGEILGQDVASFTGNPFSQEPDYTYYGGSQLVPQPYFGGTPGS